jgi:hypothetical protein
MTYDPAARSVERIKDPNDPRLYPDVGLRAAWLLAALFILIFIVVVVSLSTQRSVTSSTATGANATQPAPSR